MGELRIVATPIGNLEDITLRAIRILKESDIILCEDTRTTGKLLAAHSIHGPKLMSYHTHSSLKKIDFVIEALRNGKNIALVSDAGTPCISDPGVLLVQGVREVLGDEAQVVAIPGPSALISALSISGISASSFVFLGFIPHKKGRETLWRTIAVEHRAIVCYESSHRIMKTLQSLSQVIPNRIVVLARELTKLHEEVIQGTAEELHDILKKIPVKQKGEFVLLLAPTEYSRAILEKL